MNEVLRYTASNLGPTLDSKGIKQAWIARQVGISKSMMSKVVAGNRTVDGATAERIADLVGVPFFLLFELRERSEIERIAECAA